MFVVHLAVALGPPILEVAQELVAIFKSNAAPVLQTTVHNFAGVSRIFLYSLLDLEEVLALVFDRKLAVCPVIDELAFVHGAVGEEHLRKFGITLVCLPLALINISVRIVALALGAVSPVVAVRPFVILAV